MSPITRRDILGAAAASAATLALPRFALADTGLAPVYAEIEKRHGEGVRRLQEWIRQPSIAAEIRGMEEGCALMMKLAREAGCPVDSRVLERGLIFLRQWIKIGNGHPKPDLFRVRPHGTGQPPASNPFPRAQGKGRPGFTLCSDLFHQLGDVEPVTSADVRQ